MSPWTTKNHDFCHAGPAKQVPDSFVLELLPAASGDRPLLQGFTTSETLTEQDAISDVLTRTGSTGYSLSELGGSAPGSYSLSSYVFTSAQSGTFASGDTETA